jgi:hypothetical protein
MAVQQLHAVAFGYRKDPKIIFNDLVEEFDLALRDFGMNRRTIDFDNDDVAILRSTLAEVGLSLTASEDADGMTFILILFGHGKDAYEQGMPHDLLRKLYSSVMRQLTENWPFDSIHRASFDNMRVTGDLIDQLSEELLEMSDLSENDLDVLGAIKAAREETEESKKDALAMKALRDIYEMEEKDVRRMMSVSNSANQLGAFYDSMFSGSQNAIGKLSMKAETFRKLMLETNYPFDRTVGKTPISDIENVLQAEDSPKRSLIFGDLLIRNKWQISQMK